MKSKQLVLFSIPALLSMLVSLLAHLLILAVLFFFSKMFGQSTQEKSNIFNYVQKSIRVDMVKMPKFTVQELKEVGLSTTDLNKQSQEDNIEVIDRDTDKNPLLKNKKKVSFKDLLKNFTSKTVPKNKFVNGKKIRNRRDLKFGRNKILKKLIYAGNKIQKGTSIVGGVVGANSSILTLYAASLPEYIRLEWSLPSYLNKSKLRCRIRVFISSTGKLIKYNFIEKSGNIEFDTRAEEAIKRTPLFPRPDKTIVENVKSGEIVLGFPL